MTRQHEGDVVKRRTFLKASAILPSIGLGSVAATASPSTRPFLEAGDVVLFQGDSITDARRKRDRASTPNDPEAMGHGYAWLAAVHSLIHSEGTDLTFYNRGISGHKVPQLAKRWERDALNLKPNVLSILIGVNDIWHKLNGKYDGTVETYERDYHALIERTRQALPEVKLVICEPFVLKCGAVNDKWFPEFDGFRAASRNVADKHGALFVPFQEMFDAAVKYAPPSHWAGDGVHPSAAGSALMAHQWCRTVGGI